MVVARSNGNRTAIRPPIRIGQPRKGTISARCRPWVVCTVRALRFSRRWSGASSCSSPTTSNRRPGRSSRETGSSSRSRRTPSDADRKARFLHLTQRRPPAASPSYPNFPSTWSVNRSELEQTTNVIAISSIITTYQLVFYCVFCNCSCILILFFKFLFQYFFSVFIFYFFFYMFLL